MENEYELEELFPLAAKLARRYTNDESSSVTYERAEYLMEAVLYCIRECEKQKALRASLHLPAKLVYEQGLALVREKTKKAFEPAYIEAALQRYLPAYRSSFENLCSMFLRHVLCRLMLSIGCGGNREKLRKSIEKESIEGLQRRLKALLMELICQKWGENERLAAYLKRDIPNCAAAFLLAARYDTLDAIAEL